MSTQRQKLYNDPFMEASRELAHKLAKQFSVANLEWPLLDEHIKTIVEKFNLIDPEDLESVRKILYGILLYKWIEITVQNCWDEDEFRTQLAVNCWENNRHHISDLERENAVDDYYHALSDKISCSLYNMKEVLGPSELSVMIPELQTPLFSKERIMYNYMRHLQNLKDRGPEWKETMEILSEIYNANRPKLAKERLELPV